MCSESELNRVYAPQLWYKQPLAAYSSTVLSESISQFFTRNLSITETGLYLYNAEMDRSDWK
jgi:hypothetical protein